MNGKGWFSLARKHNIYISITSENTRDISVSISRNIRKKDPLICRMLFSLAHKHKRKKNERGCFSCAYCLCLCVSENSIRQISGFVLLLMLPFSMLMSRVFSLAYAYVMFMLVLMLMR